MPIHPTITQIGKLFNHDSEKKIPVLNCTTGIHSDYHKMSDTENKINYQGMEMIFEFTQSMLNIFQSNNW